MKQQIQALQAELLKAKYANTVWWTFIAFALAPLMGGAFIMIIQDLRRWHKEVVLWQKPKP
ncbi:MAG: hypothetical protein IPI50_07855 [Saprospiraceae bacterium]|nr:hypothetical protein [Saprospiraceae bacterium]